MARYYVGRKHWVGESGSATDLETIKRASYLASLLISLLWNTCAAEDPLASRVTIYRDTYGVPHIVGEYGRGDFLWLWLRPGGGPL